MKNLNEKIHDYIDDLLPENDRQAFELALKTDAKLAQEVHLYQDLIKGIDVATDTHLRKTIGSIQQRLAAENFFETDEKPEKQAIIRTLSSENTAKVRKLSTYQWAAAASVLLLIAAGLWFLKPNKETLFNETYTAYFQTEKAKLKEVYTEISTPSFATDKARNESLKTALDAYNTGNFAAAKSLFQAHLRIYASDFDAQFYLTQTFMALEEGQNATLLLENLAKNSSNSYQKDAQWYLALNYLTVRENREKAIKLLDYIEHDATSPYQTKAAEILKKIN